MHRNVENFDLQTAARAVGFSVQTVLQAVF